jgi:hypothetical protein
MSRIARLPSPALIVAVVALVAALAGTAIAGPGASTSKVTKSKVKKITNKQINKRVPWGTADIADNAVTTPKIANDAVTGVKLAAINTRSTTVNIPAAGTPYAEATASCQSGERLLSGGAKIENVALGEFVTVLESHKQGNNDWYARAFNAFGSDRALVVEAYCLA